MTLKSLSKSKMLCIKIVALFLLFYIYINAFHFSHDSILKVKSFLFLTSEDTEVQED